jgi:hypothetical protein
MVVVKETLQTTRTSSSVVVIVSLAVSLPLMCALIGE